MNRNVAVVFVLLLLIAAVVGIERTSAHAQVRRSKQIDREIDQLNIGLRAFREKYGAYPPAIYDWQDPELKLRLRVFLAGAFPRFDLNLFESQLRESTGLKPQDLDCAESLVFWLGGLPSREDRQLLRPISYDPTAPFAGGPGAPMFQFDITRLTDVDHDGWPEYRLSQGDCSERRPPIVYFDYRSYGIAHYPLHIAAKSSELTGAGLCVPYRDAPNGWLNADSFQLIFPGCDGIYGDAMSLTRVPSTGKGITAGDYDNRTNFVSPTLRSMIPGP